MNWRKENTVLLNTQTIAQATLPMTVNGLKACITQQASNKILQLAAKPPSMKAFQTDKRTPSKVVCTTA